MKNIQKKKKNQYNIKLEQKKYENEIPIQNSIINELKTLINETDNYEINNFENENKNEKFDDNSNTINYLNNTINNLKNELNKYKKENEILKQQINLNKETFENGSLQLNDYKNEFEIYEKKLKYFRNLCDLFNIPYDENVFYNFILIL